MEEVCFSCLCSVVCVRALGQGAFGEVYQGELANVPREPTPLPVAVKVSDFTVLLLACMH